MRIIDPQGLRLYDTRNRISEPVGRSFRSPLPNVATAITLVNSTAYFVYVGRTTQQILAKYVEIYVNSAGSATICQIGLFRTPNAPNKTNQGTNGIIKLTATGDTDVLNTTGLKRNTFSFDCVVPAGTYLWAGIRTAMTTSPALAGLCMNFSEALVLSVASASDLAQNPGPWTGSIPSLGAYLNTAIAPDLRVTMD